MPYIITTNQLVSDEGGLSGEASVRGVSTRTAVATPGDARDHVASLGASYGVMAHLDCVLDGTSRMPIGPLPDGTVIEVRRVTLAELAGSPVARYNADRTADVIAAFNAR